MYKYLFLFIFFCVTALNAQTLKVGVWHNPPMSVIENNHDIKGFLPDIFKEIAKNTHIKYQFVSGTWSDLYDKLIKNEIDLFFPIGYMESRLALMDFSKQTLYTNWGLLITTKGNDINNIRSLQGKRIAIHKNDVYFNGDMGLKKILEDFKIQYLPITCENYVEAKNKVLKGEADYALIPKSFYYLINEKNIIATTITIQPIEVKFAYSKKLPQEIKDKIDKELQSLIQNQHSYYYKRLDYLTSTGYKENVLIYYILEYYLIFFTIIFVVIVLLLIFNYLLKTKIAQKTIELNRTIIQLQNSENRLKAILTSMPGLLFIMNKEKRYIDVITNKEELLLAPKEQIIGKRPHDFFKLDLLPLLEHHIEEVVEKNQISNILYQLNIKGETRYFESTGVPMMIGGETFGLFHILERTEIVKANEALKKLTTEISIEKDKLNRILNSIKEMVIVANNDLMITYANRSALNIIGPNISGTPLDALPIKDSKTENSIFSIYATNFFSQETNIKNAYLIIDSKKIFIEGSVQPIYDHHSQLSGAVLVLKDITAEKQLEEELIRADKLESIGRIASGIAHDFNNYLGAIQNYVNVIMLNEDENIQKLANAISTVVQRSKSLTKQLLTFAKGGQPVLKLIDLRELIKEVSTFSLRGSNIKEEFNISEEPLCAEIDEGLFSQVISNIVINAREAMNDNGVIKISAHKIDMDESNEYGLIAGRYIKVSVKDSGPGVPEALSTKIFEPFFTTKSRGTGLGLATCYSIIKQHKGHLTFKNHLDGCEFIFFIPLNDKHPCNQKQENITHFNMMDKNISVIYMDDEEILRDSFEILLETLGSKVKTVSNGEELLEAVKSEPFDIVVLDLTIRSGLNGLETMNRLKKMGIKSYFVVSSGYSDDLVIQEKEKYGFNDYLPKPYSLKEVKELLERYSKYISHSNGEI
ncbi:MAG: transporter substrate-binding domain-containing protein [Calditerrivibrio sp.]|nr:transporter substrate-binding domain-containing protein [Calditerrivibrio sp.]